MSKALENSTVTTNTLVNPDLKLRIEKIETLPTLPEVYCQLVSELSTTDVSIKRIANIILQDAALSAKVLQVVNSAFFAVKTEVQSVQQAVNFLGTDTIKGIVLTVEVFSGTEYTEIPGFSLAELYQRGMAVGPKARFIAYCLGLQKNQMDSALTAGLLHDVGKLVLLTGFAEEFKEACEYSKKENVPLQEAQVKIIGADDAAIGGFLLTSWGLSQSIIEAVSLHYKPSICANPELDTTAAVHLAYASEHNQQFQQKDSTQTAFDLTYTDSLGISGQISQFEGLTAEAVALNN